MLFAKLYTEKHHRNGICATGGRGGGLQGRGSVWTDRQTDVPSNCDRDQKGVKDTSTWLCQLLGKIRSLILQ